MSLPPKIETVLLDAGGVLLDLDYRYLRRLCRAHGAQTTEESLSRYEATARVDIHKAVHDGGRVSDIEGRPLDFTRGRTLDGNRGVVATCGPIHDEVIEVVRSVRAESAA